MFHDASFRVCNSLFHGISGSQLNNLLEHSCSIEKTDIVVWQRLNRKKIKGCCKLKKRPFFPLILSKTSKNVFFLQCAQKRLVLNLFNFFLRFLTVFRSAHRLDSISSQIIHLTFVTNVRSLFYLCSVFIFMKVHACLLGPGQFYRWENLFVGFTVNQVKLDKQIF